MGSDPKAHSASPVDAVYFRAFGFTVLRQFFDPGPLGQEIDREQLDVASVLEEEDGFVVIGSISGRYENQCFSYSELQENGAPDSARLRGSASAAGAKPGFAIPDAHTSPLRHRLHLTQ